MLHSKLFSIVSTLLVAAVTSFGATVWDGSADTDWYTGDAQAYNLTTAEQLAGLAKLVNEGTCDFLGKTITLGADIFLNDTAGAAGGTWASVSRRVWTPIGTAAYPFKGEFDGLAGLKKRKIYGLFFNESSSDYVGLFGYTSGVKISNLDLLVGRITAQNNVGALIGRSLLGSVTNVYSEVKVNGLNYVGGLVGYSTGSISRGSVSENVSGQDYVGGVVGYISGSVTGTVKSNSYFKGTLTGRKYVGGIAGRGTSISYAYVTGDVKGADLYVGGVVGSASGSVLNVSHVGTFVEGYSYVGGVAGLAGLVESSFNEGLVAGKLERVGGVAGMADSVFSSHHKMGNVTGSANYVGGVAGYSKKIKSSYAEGHVSGTTDYVGGVAGYASDSVTFSYHVGGNVSGREYVGGVAGQSGVMRNSYNEGAVTGGKKYVGGVVGYTTSATDSSHHTNGDVSGFSYVGGIAGYGGAIKNSYSEGSVKGDSAYVGGIVGFGKGILDSLSHTKGFVRGLTYVGGVVGNVSAAVKNSHNKGDVVGDSNYVGGIGGFVSSIDSCSHEIGSISGGMRVGGIAGYVTSYVRSSYNKGGTVSGLDSVGGVAGHVGNSLQNVHANENVSGRSYVGGVAGYVGSAVGGAHFTGAKVNGTGSYIGGLIGRAGSVVDSSYSLSDVSGHGYTGGLVGYAAASIKNSYASGVVKGGSSYTGGVVGYGSGIRNVRADKSVTGTRYVGGIAGYSGAVDLATFTGPMVEGSSSEVGGISGYASGVIDSSSARTDVVSTTGNNVGGIVGSTSHEISFVEHYGEVKGGGHVGGIVGNISSSTVSNSSHSGGDVTGGNYVGGLIGYSSYVSSGSAYKNLKVVDESFAEANVIGSSYVGGLVGYDTLGRSGSYKAQQKIQIASSHAIGTVKGNNFVGGITGKMVSGYSAANYGDSLYMVIDSCYHEYGEVSGRGDFVGGVAGYIAGSVLKSHHRGGAVSGKDYVGGLIGETFRYVAIASTTVDNSVYKSYAVADVSGDNYVGGLIGFDSTYRYTTSSSYSYTKAFLNSYSKGKIEGKSNVGGLIGSSVKASSNSSYVLSKVDSSSHSGGGVLGSGNNVGGLLGRFYGAVNYSYHKGGPVTGMDSVGGLAGSVVGSIRGSYAEEMVKGRNSVGGLAGYVGSTVDDCYFSGDSVVGIYQVGGLIGESKGAVDSSYASGHVKGDDNVGGLLGSSYNSVSNSFALGNVIGDVDNSSAGNDNLGGLVGYAYSGSITKSMALGDVTGTTKIGGLVGRFEGTSISQSYAAGNITGRFDGDPAESVGNYYIGGLVGYGKGSISETYASGAVKGIEPVPVYTGCLIGYVSSSMSIQKSYYDSSICKLGVEGVDPETEEGLASISGKPAQTTYAMQTQSTFVNWDFMGTWRILENTYPFLQIYTNSLSNAVVMTEDLSDIHYLGTTVQPLVTSVTLFGTTLTWETEYSISYENNDAAGMAIIKVCGLKPYSGCKVIPFEIKGTDITPTISAISDVPYTGFEIKPAVTVYNGEEILDPSTYVLKYENNVNVGKASVSVSVRGSYSGSASANFNIIKATPTIMAKPTASDVALGLPLSSSVLSNGVASTEGTFAWKTPTTLPTLANEGYAVVFTPADVNNYNVPPEFIVAVTVVNQASVLIKDDETVIVDTHVDKGSSYILPEAPEKIGYIFSGWYNGTAKLGDAGTELIINENIEILAKYTPIKYLITFANYDDAMLQSGKVDYDVIPVYTGAAPAKPATAQYTYTFQGWTPDIAKVSSDAVYKAVYDSVVNEYSIAFLDIAGTTLQSGKLPYGATPVYEGENPTRAATVQYTYTFQGWTPAIADVTENVSYTAAFDSTVNEYAITFKNSDGTILQSGDVPYGTVPVYAGATPTKVSTTKYVYTFAGWTPELTSVTDDASYTAVFDSADVTYIVAFVDYDSTKLQSDNLLYNAMPTYKGETPARASTAQYTYTFKGWTPTLAKATADVIYKAVYDSVVNKYAVTFQNYDGISLQSGDLDYDALPVYQGEDPTRTATAQYTYTFAGWTPEVTKVTKPVTYKAVYDSTVNDYEVVFANFDGRTLQRENVPFGSVPVYKGMVPTKAASDKYSFTFKGWSPAITAVQKSVTYTAVYDSADVVYLVAFLNYDGSVLQAEDLAYGASPVYGSSDPVRPATAKYSYVFRGWKPEIASVTGVVTYEAVYDSVVNEYTIAFVGPAGEELQSSKVPYGKNPTFYGTTPSKTATVAYSYTFAGWNPEISTVVNHAAYVASFDSVLNKYTVTFKNADGVRLQSEALTYGSIPSYLGSTPSMPSTARYKFIFSGWTPDISGVIGSTTYTAQYDTIDVLYQVTFKDYNGLVLQENKTLYGTIPSYAGAEPRRSATAMFSYVFKGWTPSLASVTESVTYEAVYDSVVNKYWITFLDQDNEEVQNSRVEYGSVPVYYGETPSKNATAAYSYTFARWSPELVAVRDDAIYRPVFDSTLNKYTVTFRNADGSKLQSEIVAYGSIPAYNGVVPSMDATAQHSYTFVGWKPAVAAVSGTTTYVAQYDTTDVTYVISFVDYNGVNLQSKDLTYGSMPKYTGSVPTRAATAQYAYSFKKWSPSITSVTGSAVYKAVYDSVVNEYTVAFVDEDGSPLSSSKMSYGQLPTAADPKKASTAQYSYEFAGWTPAISSVTGNVTYQATYRSSLNSYTVVFVDDDSTEISRSVVAYGKTPSAPVSPEKAATDQHSYEFAGWSPAVTVVKGEAVYKATYTSSLNRYTATFVDRNGSVLKTSSLNYGALPSAPSVDLSDTTDENIYTFVGWSPSLDAIVENTTYTAVYTSVARGYRISFVNDELDTISSTVVAYGDMPDVPLDIPTKASNAQYSYSFSGWTPEVRTVTGNQTYAAVFTSTVNRYTITFVDEDGSMISETSLAYGKTPTAPIDPVKVSSAQNSYEFAGWSPAIVNVDGNATYVATYVPVGRSYKVTFVDDEGNKISSSSVAYGKEPSLPNDPKKASTVRYTYTFAGWTPEVGKVAGDVIYTATFDAAIRHYVVTFVDDDGTEISTTTVAYGKTPTAPSNPEKSANAQYAYEFAGWSPAISKVTGDALYKASYNMVLNAYKVTFLDHDGTVLKTQTVNYGKPASAPADPERDGYKFDGWNKIFDKVVGDLKVTAQYDKLDSSSENGNAFASVAAIPDFSVDVADRSIQIRFASVGSVYAVVDMQGRILKNGYVNAANFCIDVPSAGTYLIRIGSQVRRVVIK